MHTSSIDDLIHRLREESDSSSTPKTRAFFFQLNCQRSVVPSDNLSTLLSSSSNSFGMIQEPCFNNNKVQGFGYNVHIYHFSSQGVRPRAAIVAPRSLTKNLLPMPQFTNRDMATVLLSNPYRTINKSIILSSVYWGHDQNQLPDEFIKLLQHASSKNMPLLISMDANAHSTTWGSSDNNARGIELLNVLSSFNMVTLNNSNFPTFQNSRRAEVLDITITNKNFTDLFTDWTVLNTPSLSDHNIIKFSLTVPLKIVKKFRSIKNTDWQLFESLCSEYSSTFAYIMELTDMNKKVNYLQNTLHTLWERSCPLKYITNPKSVPWWNSELSASRRRLKNLKKRKNSSKLLSDKILYTDQNNLYRKQRFKAQKNSWREFTSRLGNRRYCNIYRRLLKRGHTFTTSIKKPDGSFTSSFKETLDLIIETNTSSATVNSPAHFRQSTPTNNQQNSTSHLDTSNILSRQILAGIVKDLKPHTSPGPDGLHNAVLQHSWFFIQDIVISIFNQSLHSAVLPNSWQCSNAILLPKSLSSSSPSSFRIINLSNNLLKVLEKCILIHLQESLHISHSDSQFGFKTGTSTEAALHHLCSKLHRNLSKKVPSIGIFIDLKSAFDNISFESIRRALESRSIPIPLINWIMNYVSNRYVTFTLGSYSVTRHMLKGSPQGGVLSPFLFNLVIDGLLHEINILQPDSLQGFADDLVATLADTDPFALHSKAQRHIDHIYSWCLSTGLSINTLKTKIIIFTNKRSFSIPPLVIAGTDIPYSKETKFLGVTIDSKLRFSRHVSEITTKSRARTSVAQKFIGATWGITPYRAKWSYDTHVQSSFTYGSIVWQTALNSKQNLTKLMKAEAASLRSMTRSFKSCPAHVLYTITNITPLHLHIFKASLLSLYRLASSPSFSVSAHPTPSTDHLLRQIENLNLPLPGHIDLIQHIPMHHKYFLINIDPNIRTTIVNSHHLYTNIPPSSLNIFTDGSKTKSATSAGYIIYSNCNSPVCGKVFLKPFNSIFQAEAAAIIQALTLHVLPLMDRDLTNTLNINIYTDSKSVLNSLQQTKLKTRTVERLHSSLNHIGQHHYICLHWVPGHQNVKGNEEADFLATSRREDLLRYNNITFSNYDCHPPLSIVKQKFKTLKKIAIKNLTSQSNSTNRLKSLIHFLANSKITVSTFKRSSISDVRLLSQVLSGHSHLNYFKSKIDRNVSPTCSHCQEDQETSFHYLCSCPFFTESRCQYLGKRSLSLFDLYKCSLSQLLKFIKSTKRFEHLL